MLHWLLSKDKDTQRLLERAWPDEVQQRLKEDLIEEVVTALCNGAPVQRDKVNL
jgi:hypothetical protein